MATMIKCETVSIVVKTLAGSDDFGQPKYTTSTENVANVIVGSPSSEDIINELNISGKHISFVLGIPDTDEHDWIDTECTVRGLKCRTIGIPTEYTAGNMPSWWHHNKQVKVEHYE